MQARFGTRSHVDRDYWPTQGEPTCLKKIEASELTQSHPATTPATDSTARAVPTPAETRAASAAPPTLIGSDRRAAASRRRASAASKSTPTWAAMTMIEFPFYVPKWAVVNEQADFLSWLGFWWDCR